MPVASCILVAGHDGDGVRAGAEDTGGANRVEPRHQRHADRRATTQQIHIDRAGGIQNQHAGTEGQVFGVAGGDSVGIGNRVGDARTADWVWNALEVPPLERWM